MSRTRVWLSIAVWAAVALFVVILSNAVLRMLYPWLHVGVLVLAAILAVNVVYLFRSFARRRGWAMASYAPQSE